MKRHLLAAAGLAGILACGSDTPTQPGKNTTDLEAAASTIAVALRPKVDGIVEDSALVVDRSVVQAVNVPNFEDRGIMEFDVRDITGPVSRAWLILRVYGSNGPYPFRLDVFGYRGNGILEVADWGRGTRVMHLPFAGDSLLKLDVTASVRALLSGGADFVGFSFRVEHSDVFPNGPFVAFRSREYPPAGRLRILMQ